MNYGDSVLGPHYFSPKLLSEVSDSELRSFLLYQKNMLKRAPGSVNVYNSACRFIFGAIVGRYVNYQQIPRAKIVRSLPDIIHQSHLHN